ncbi:MAG: hypothetical protein ACNYPE_10500 [Candidatus Azotimanducaceae bacterium WSBS_2022_MAG_OTU7]
MIRVIAFDLDDTLWNVAPVIRRAESILAAWLEKEVPRYQYEQSKLMPIRETLLGKDPPWATGLRPSGNNSSKHPLTLISTNKMQPLAPRALWKSFWRHETT